MAIATSPTREKFPLSPKKVTKKTLAGTIMWIVVSFIIYIFIAAMSLSSPNVTTILGIATPVIFGLLLVIIFLNYFYQKWYFNVYFYDLTSDYIIIKKGPITPHEITIPYERVQDVYVDQDIFDRMFGLYDVHLSSATVSSGMEAHIDGVEKPAAEGLRAELLKTVSSRISKNRPASTHQASTNS